MSLLDELETRGVTAEDLEKAASVRLFEKAAAAEGVDLDSLDVDQVEDLYAAFLSNPSATDTHNKEASAMNDEIVDLFEKTAAAEGIDLDSMADDELAELYNHYVENVLPGQVEEYEKEAAASEVDEATEKLAEAEILGRHMARAFMDEQDELLYHEKEAGKRIDNLKAKARAGMDRAARAQAKGEIAARDKVRSLKERYARRGMSKGRRFARSAGQVLSGSELRQGMKDYRAASGRRGAARRAAHAASGRRAMIRGGGKTLAAYGGLAAGAAAARSAMKKQSSYDPELEAHIEDLALELAEDILDEVLFED